MAGLPQSFVVGQAATERMGAFLSRAEAIGLRAEIVEAVFPEGEAPWSPHYDDAARRRRLGYPMWRGEVGCFLSHRDVWRRVVERGLVVALVLEDDAAIDGARLPELAEACQLIAGRAMVVRLVSDPRPDILVWRELRGGACLGLPVRFGNLTAAYLVTLEAARALLAASERFDYPVDDFINHTHRHGVDVLNLEPELARHLPVGSVIGPRLKPRVAPLVKLRRECLRIIPTLRIFAAHLGARLRLGLLLARPRPPDGGA